jgi:Concanavalin A-like lectin/glucanases superfamily
MSRIRAVLAYMTIVIISIAVPLGDASAQTCAPPPLGMVSWYRMEGDTTDWLNANDPSNTSGVSFVAGEVGQGVSLASGGFIDIADSPSLQVQPLTLDAWVRPDGPGPNDDAAGSIIVGKNFDADAVSVQIAWTTQSGGRFRFNFYGGSIVSADPFPAGAFYFVVATYDGSTFSLYVNGALEGSASVSETIPYSTVPWTIGVNNPDARGLGFPRTWNGVIDEVEIFGVALSAIEIGDIYAAGSTGKCLTTPTPLATATPTVTPTATLTPTPTVTATPRVISGKKLLIKDNPDNHTKRKIIFLSKDPNIVANGLGDGSGVDPMADGATLQVYNANGGVDNVCFPLPGSLWQAKNASTLFKYKDATYSVSACKTAQVKSGKLLKVVCQAKLQQIDYSLNNMSQGAVAVRFISGGITYCADFGGLIKKDSGTDPPVAGGKGQFAAKDAPAPLTCPTPPSACP